MKKSLVIGSGMLLAFAAASALADRLEDRIVGTPATFADLGPPASDGAGQELLGQIEAKWAKVMRMQGWTEGALVQFRAYRNYPVGVLEEALAAPTFERMQSVFDSYATLAARETMAKAFPARRAFNLSATAPDVSAQVMEAKQAAAKALGEDARDLVFIPITPCTVWDSRFATDPPAAGIIGDAVTKTFYSHFNGAGGTFAPWGGNPSCPETAQNFIGGRPFAVMMTVYINDATANGWLTFYRNGDADPSQATISVYYSTGPTRTQTVIAKSNRGYGVAAAYDIAVTGRFASAHGAASVTGYFIKPGATALECNEQFASGTAGSWLNGGTYSVNHTACLAGYTRTGYACSFVGTLPAGVSLLETGTSFNYCEWRNSSGMDLTTSVTSLRAGSHCCRVPGR